MEMNHSLCSWGDQLFGLREVKDMKLCLEHIADLAVVSVVADDVPSQNLFLFDSFNLEFHVLSCRSVRNTDIAWVVDLFDLEGLLGWEEGYFLVFDNSS